MVDAYKVCFIVLVLMLLLHLILLLASVVLQSVAIRESAELGSRMKSNITSGEMNINTSSSWLDLLMSDNNSDTGGMIFTSDESSEYCTPVRHVHGNVLMSLCKKKIEGRNVSGYLDVVDLRKWNFTSSQPTIHGFNISLSAYESMCSDSIRRYFV